MTPATRLALRASPAALALGAACTSYTPTAAEKAAIERHEAAQFAAGTMVLSRVVARVVTATFLLVIGLRHTLALRAGRATPGEIPDAWALPRRRSHAPPDGGAHPGRRPAMSRRTAVATIVAAAGRPSGAR
ncbi:MAG: hypothetical protein ACRDHY_06950 [Anaerolineales bacterium]